MVHTATLDEVDRVTVSRAARVLECSEGTVRYLADHGHLPCAWFCGRRVFELRNVVRLRDERAARQREQL